VRPAADRPSGATDKREYRADDDEGDTDRPKDRNTAKETDY
jgi:hypothetical protein